MTRSADGSAVVPDRAAVLKALEAVVDPRTGQGLVSAGLVRGLALRPGRAGFMLEVACKDVAVYESVRTQAESALTKVINVAQAQVVLTTLDGPPSPPERSYAVHSHAPPARGAPGSALTGPAPPADPGLLEANEAQRSARGSAPSAERSGALKPPFVRQVIAVASGKGGVGKSTLAVNLAAAFAALGYRTGLLDADVYGPSVPRMLGLTEEPRVGPDKKLIPLQAFGIKAVSIGLLVKEGSPMIWRGPMASSALTQLLQDVAWGSAEEPLDLLIVDMPPGTGDIQLTLSQRVRLDGAVIVSTPQEVALIDVRRGAAMFQKTDTPILGVIENMAYFEDPSTGAPIEIFGRGGAQRVARELGAPFLGEVPIDIALRASGDEGRPITASAPASPCAQRILAIAQALAERLGAGDLQKPPPRIRTV